MLFLLIFEKKNEIIKNSRTQFQTKNKNYKND